MFCQELYVWHDLSLFKFSAWMSVIECRCARANTGSRGAMLTTTNRLITPVTGGDINRDEVLSTLPGNDEFQAAPNYKKKEIVAGLIRTILNQLDGEQRGPDRWEAEHLAAAIGYLLSDWYSAATTATVKALAPPDERANPETWARTDDTITTRALRDGLDYAAGKPARNG